MTSVASRPSYQSIQCAPAGWALRQPDRLYHVLCIRTSREVRQTSSSQAGISTHSASSLHSHAVGTFVVSPSIPSSMLLLLLLLVGGGSMTVEKRDVPLGVAANRWWGMEKQDVQVGAIKTARPIRAWWSSMLMRLVVAFSFAFFQRNYYVSCPCSTTPTNPKTTKANGSQQLEAETNNNRRQDIPITRGIVVGSEWKRNHSGWMEGAEG